MTDNQWKLVVHSLRAKSVPMGAQRITTADKFALLFSTDWFRPHWTVTGFVPQAADGQLFQQSMRKLVDAIIGDAPSYWLVEFSEPRLCRTRDEFLQALDSCDSSQSDLSLIRAMVANRGTSDTLTAVSMMFWNNYEAIRKLIACADITSTDWDRHIVALTPDLPSHLQDFVCVSVLGGVSERLQ